MCLNILVALKNVWRSCFSLQLGTFIERIIQTELKKKTFYLEEFIIAKVIGSWVDMLCSGSGDCGMQGGPYTKALQGIQGSHQDPAAFGRVTGEAWAAPGAPLLCHTQAASEEHEQPGAGKQGGQTGCGASVRAW